LWTRLRKQQPGVRRVPLGKWVADAKAEPAELEELDMEF